MNNLQYQNQSSKGLTALKIIIVVLVLVLVSGAAYGTWKIFSKPELVFLPGEPTEESTTEPATLESTIQHKPDRTANWNTYRNEKYGYELKYPESWYYLERQDRVSFLPPGAEEEMRIYYEYRPPIDIFHRENPMNLNLKSFYDGVNAPNLFSDALRGYLNIQIVGKEAIKFKGVVGMEESTVAVVPIRDAMIEIWDYGEDFQENGIFHQILYSLSLIE